MALFKLDLGIFGLAGPVKKKTGYFGLKNLTMTVAWASQVWCGLGGAQINTLGPARAMNFFLDCYTLFHQGL